MPSIICIMKSNSTHGSADGVDGFRDIVDVLQLPEIYGLEHVHVGDSKLCTGLVEPTINHKTIYIHQR